MSVQKAHYNGNETVSEVLHIDCLRNLDCEVNQATRELLAFLPELRLENSIRQQAVKEFSQAFNVILNGYRNEQISYETGYELIQQIKSGFIESSKALLIKERGRQVHNYEKQRNGSYRRNVTVNNESFNIRFHASCKTAECMMHNANIDMSDYEFQNYIEALIQDKRSDVMQVINIALITNPYLKYLEYAVLGDIAYSALKEKNLNPLWAYAMGKGAYYRLRLINMSKRLKDTSENVVSYLSGSILSDGR